MAKYANIQPFYDWLNSIMKEDKTSYPDHNTLMFYEIIDELDSLPKVVRCKDCKHWTPSGGAAGNREDDLQPIGGCDWAVCCRKANDFCSYGERRSDD